MHTYKNKLTQIILSLISIWIGLPECSVAGIFPTSWLHSLVLIEKKATADKEIFYDGIGTGFLTNKPEKEHIVLVTNLHVLSQSDKNSQLYIRLSKRKKENDKYSFIRLPLQIIPERYVTAKDDDLVALYVIVPNKYDLSEFHIAPIAPEFFLSIDNIPLGDPIFLIGFPTSLGLVKEYQETANTPIIRSGIVSAIYTENQNHSILIDAPIYWGNSGGPVFILPRNTGDIKSNPGYKVPPESTKKLMFIGIATEMVPATHRWGKYENEQGEEVDLDSAWHSGLSTVIPADIILRLLEQLPDLR